MARDKSKLANITITIYKIKDTKNFVCLMHFGGTAVAVN